MALDFGTMVLGPCMDVFADPIALTPTVSQPNAAAYPARGVFAQKPVQVPLDDGTFYSTVQPTLGIRLADYPVPPKQGDSFVRAGVTWFVGNIVLDGQGGADMELRRTDPRSEAMP